MCGDSRAGERNRRLIAIQVIGMAVRVDDVRHAQSLGPRAVDHLVGRIGRIDQHADAGGTVAQQVPEITIPAGANLLEDERHDESVTHVRKRRGLKDPGHFTCDVSRLLIQRCARLESFADRW